MTEREKVIVGLTDSIEILSDFDTQEYTIRERQQLHGSVVAAIQDALALLKTLKPRVMTLEEFNAHWKTPPQERQPIWEEWKFDNGKGKWKMYGRATGGYGELWRCWTARPDQATREATPWE